MTDAPAFDPAVHTLEDNPTVLLQMWCQCGMTHRQTDPVSHVLPQLDWFRAQHSGEGHGPTTADDALAEREARREAGFRAIGRKGDYRPKTYATPDGDSFDWTGTD